MSHRPVAVLVAAEPDEHVLFERLLQRHFPMVELQLFADPVAARDAVISKDVKLLLARGRAGAEDGVAFITQIRHLRPDLPIIFMTLRHDLAERVRAAELTPYVIEDDLNGMKDAIAQALKLS